MINESRLQAGQVIKRADGQLFRVDYVNECRARIVPLSKTIRALEDKREMDAERYGTSISPRAAVEIVTDLDRARTEIELREAEEELHDIQQALGAIERTEGELAAAEAEVLALRAQQAAAGLKPETPATSKPNPSNGRGTGWRQAVNTTFKPGTLAAAVWAYIGLHPGSSTSEIVAGVTEPGAIAACVSRFHQNKLITRSE